MILVTGGSGQLGTAMRAVFPDAWFPSRGEFDLSDLDGMRQSLAATAPSLIVNCAAYTAVDRAEQEEAMATLINGAAVEVMAAHAAAADIRFVTFSTDYVFDGTADKPYTESDPVAPINAYGRSKLAGEQLALAAYPHTLVIRTSWVISATHPNFVATMLRLVRERDAVSVVDDQVGCPTVASDLAAATAQAVGCGATGIVHLTNRGATTWFELARAAVDLAGGDPGKIQPCGTADFPTAAARPAFSVLGSERCEALGIDVLPGWRDSLPAVVEGQLAR